MKVNVQVEWDLFKLKFLSNKFTFPERIDEYSKVFEIALTAPNFKLSDTF